MGYSPTNKAYRVWLNNKRRIEGSHDVTFNGAKMSSQNPNIDVWVVGHKIFKFDGLNLKAFELILVQLLVAMGA